MYEDCIEFARLWQRGKHATKSLNVVGEAMGILRVKGSVVESWHNVESQDGVMPPSFCCSDIMLKQLKLEFGALEVKFGLMAVFVMRHQIGFVNMHRRQFYVFFQRGSSSWSTVILSF